MPDRRKKRLALRSTADGTFTVELDGQPLTFVSRVEFVADANGHAAARLTIPAAILEVDAEVDAFVTAHSDQADDSEPKVNIEIDGTRLTKQDVHDAVRLALHREMTRGSYPLGHVRR